MTVGYTPGPWLHRVDKYAGDEIFASGTWEYVLMRGVDPDTGHDVVAIPNTANANLIAAAPEILEALEEMAGHLVAFSDQELAKRTDPATFRAVKMAQRAIAKAKRQAA